MSLADLEHDYRHDRFYVPAFAVKVGGLDVVRNLYLAVTSVSIDLGLNAASRFSFTIASSFDWAAGEFLANEHEDRLDLLKVFAFGSEVTIKLGYGSTTKLQPVLKGFVTEIGTSYSTGSTPELTISGMDGLYPLTIGQKTRHWEGKPYSYVVEELAAEAGLQRKIQPTRQLIDRIDQSNQSDLELLDDFVKRNQEFVFYEREGRLHFNPRRHHAQPVGELTWGEGLLSFNPEANIALQIAEVRVHGHSADTGEPLVGTAGHKDQPDVPAGEDSGGSQLTKFMAKRAVLNVRLPVRNQEEADARARAIMDQRAQTFVTGSGECVGVPVILPDTTLELKGLGRAFSKIYYVTGATHKIDGSGYRTTFKVQEPSL